MSSGKLDQSLDDILSNRRASGRRGAAGRRGGAGRPAASQAPVGGIQKAQKQSKQAKAVPTGPAAASGGDNKIMISNLPKDVDEASLKEYFASSGVGKPKRIIVNYGPNGQSQGSATVIFFKADQATEAAKTMNEVKIDNRPIRVELLISAAHVPTRVSKASLADRISQPKKDKPKPATTEKASAGTRGRGRGRGRARGGRGASTRGPKKTVQELDAEMEDYFPAGEGGNTDAMVTNGGTAVNGGAADTAMDDEML